MYSNPDTYMQGPAMYPQVGFCYPTQQPSMTTGFPVTRTDQFYHPPAGSASLDIQYQTSLKWSTGLCGCCEDVGNCCVTFWCPCVTFGQVAEIVDNGTTSCCASGVLYALISVLPSCQCLYSCFYRTKMRRQYALEERPCNDCLVHCFCESCALCQEYRELKGRGFDMSIGWHANMERRGGVPVPPAPVVLEGMTR